jgi:hypothetical protein
MAGKPAQGGSRQRNQRLAAGGLHGAEPLGPRNIGFLARLL